LISDIKNVRDDKTNKSNEADDVQEECPRVSPPTKLISDHNYVCNILDIYD